ncbi:MAG: type II toxin-antitoxin system VapC family toxin [Crocosphaera sp.]
MNFKYLLDTNILSEAIRPKTNQKVLRKLQKYQQELTTATIVIHELLFGCYRLPLSKKRQTLQTYIETVILANIPILNYDLRSAQWQALERARLTSISKTPAFIDGQIAAISYTNQLILVTNNVSDFQYFQGLSIENWFD